VFIPETATTGITRDGCGEGLSPRCLPKGELSYGEAGLRRFLLQTEGFLCCILEKQRALHRRQT